MFVIRLVASSCPDFLFLCISHGVIDIQHLACLAMRFEPMIEWAIRTASREFIFQAGTSYDNLQFSGFNIATEKIPGMILSTPVLRAALVSNFSSLATGTLSCGWRYSLPVVEETR